MFFYKWITSFKVFFYLRVIFSVPEITQNIATGLLTSTHAVWYPSVRDNHHGQDPNMPKTCTGYTYCTMQNLASFFCMYLQYRCHRSCQKALSVSILNSPSRWLCIFFRSKWKGTEKENQGKQQKVLRNTDNNTIVLCFNNPYQERIDRNGFLTVPKVQGKQPVLFLL